MLNILEGYKLMTDALLPSDHLMVEAMRRAVADRGRIHGMQIC